MEVELETGRTHQVRVHLTSLGHSILGDPVYGTPTEKQTKWQALPKQVQKEVQLLPGQALHARVLGFQHPVTGEQMRFEAAPPAQFQNLLDTMASFSSNRR
jgi:23S rRNA pseudouridine1911/1915/1917 synthase